MAGATYQTAGSAETSPRLPMWSRSTIVSAYAHHKIAARIAATG
jgi:hypothetical protein